MANCGILLNDGTSFLLLNTGDFYLLNDNSCATEPGGGSPPPVVTTPVVVPSIGVGRSAWLNRLPKKKKKLVDELDEMLLEVRARIEETPEVEPAVVQQFRDTEAFVNSQAIAEASMAQIQDALNSVQQIIREIDDEETILLAIH